MKRLIITTTCRKTKPDEPSGYLYVFDLATWEILQRGLIIEPAFREVDPNPRGGFRGGKGIAVLDDQILLANSVAIFRFDQNWQLLKTISHPSCSGIHDILLDRDNILWVTSARNDILFKFDLNGNLIDHYYYRESQRFRSSQPWAQEKILSQKEIENGNLDFRDPRTHKITKHDTVHINSISQQPDGSFLVSLGLVAGKKFSTLMMIKDLLSKLGFWQLVLRLNESARNFLSIQKDRHSDIIFQPADGKSMVVKIIPDGYQTLCFEIENVTVPSHSILSRSDGTAIYLNTTKGDIIHFTPQDGHIISSTFITHQFLRGIFQLSEKDLIVGSQNNILWFDQNTKEIKRQVQLSEDANEAVFAIHDFPENFALPPISFEVHLGKLVGFNQREVIFG